jgi:hypothetical protein
MYQNGQQVLLHLGQDRKLYINSSPGKALCVFEGRIFLKAYQGKDVISITRTPDNFDGGLVTSPPGMIIQGLDQK